MTRPGQPQQGQPDPRQGPALGATPPPAAAEGEEATNPGPMIGRLPSPAAPGAPAAGAVSAPGRRSSAQPWAGQATAAPAQAAEAAEAGAEPGGSTMMMTPTRADTDSTSRLSTGAGAGTAASRAAAAAAVAEQVQRAASAAQPALAEPTGGTVYGGNRVSAVPEPERLGRPLDPLRVEPHRAPVAALQQLAAPRVASGVLLGRDSSDASVVLRLFRPEVTRVALVGGLWPTRLLIFRGLALGARVVVFTYRPDAWNGFGRAATGRDDRVAVLPAERPVVVAASPASPALHVYDLGSTGPQAPPALGPWNAQLTVLPSLTAFGFDAVQAAHLTVLRRLGAQEATAAVPVLGLTGRAPSLVQQVRDDMVSVVGAGSVRYTFLRPTPIETRLFGGAGGEQPAGVQAGATR